ncbi:MAG: acetyltransferase [Bacteroidota bacterium]
MYLLGASGHAKVVIDILELSNQHIDCLFDKDESITHIQDYNVLPEQKIKQHYDLIISIGDNLTRKKVWEKFPYNKYGIGIHPRSIISKRVLVLPGSVVVGGAIINSDTVIGNHAIINTASSVDHDCKIGDFVHIAPNSTLCGGVTIGEGTLIGANAVVIPGIKVGKWCVVGAGSVVVNDIPDYSLVVGNPARVIRYLND